MRLYPRQRRHGRALRTWLGVVLATLVLALVATPTVSASGSAGPPGAALTVPATAAPPGARTPASVAPPAPAPARLADGAVGARVVVGFRHTCVLTRTGGVQCWGDDTYGQLGRGTSGASSAVPQWVSGLRSGVASLSAGEDHTCVVTTAGAVRCWGSNTWGMLGDATTVDRSTPVTPTALTSGMRSVSAGAQQTCAQRTIGAVLCWGWNGSGGLGDGTTTDRLSPVTVKGLPSDVTSVSAGFTYACALTSGGRLWCWGGSRWLAGAGEYFALTTPRLVGLTGVRQIAARLDRTCAVTTAGATWCWGGPGEIGDGRNYVPDAPVPSRVETLGDGSTSAVAPGQASTCVLTPAGAVRCWGTSDLDLGDLLYGNSRTIGAWRPQSVTGLASGIVQVEDNYDHRCALTSAGAVLCWGRGAEGQLGRGSATAAAPSPSRDRSDRSASGAWRTDATTFMDAVQRGVRTGARPGGAGSGPEGAPTGNLSSEVSAVLPTVAQVATGATHACARTTTARLWCWGDNQYGQAPGAQGPLTTTPTEVTALSGVTDVGLGDDTTCAVVSSRTWCWGLNLQHQVSPSDEEWYVATPTRYDALPVDVTQVGSGLAHSCALRTAGGVSCWGSNFQGGLGDGTSDDSATPVVPVGLGSGVASLAEGTPNCVLMTSGQVRCWSFASPTRDSATPVVVPLPAAATSVTVGEAACALLTTGAVYCWGDNRFGYLGDGTLTPRTGIRLVRGLESGVTAISSGGSVTCAVLAAGPTRCWGGSSAGLGNASVNWSSVPKQVGSTGAAVRRVAVGSGFACVLDARPSVWCWGDSYHGQLALPPEAVKRYSRLPLRIG
ncbi:alpha-tubulin suppressor-like RCC1 family protein [Terracoccus luteus]|uniref:Alpha-tubulin suppressor-like RCC1 family protein n=1 Tax=Terracoccus luteus TaxID=53356 RepID=A0A495Y3P6_9MICO|nr:alpha-tubulin suppressor-like RCC1 family protein [Terracoccus luteus]